MDPRYSKVRGQLLWVIVHGSVKISAPLTVDGNAARTALNCFWVDDAKPGTKPLARRRFAINPLGMVRLLRRYMLLRQGLLREQSGCLSFAVAISCLASHGQREQ